MNTRDHNPNWPDEEQRGSRIVEVKGLSFNYPSGPGVLRDVSLTCFSQENVGIVGPHGAGKTTLLLHLNGTLRGTGEVRVLNRVVTRATVPELRSRVGMLFQNPGDSLFCSTVREEVSFAPRCQGHKDAAADQIAADAVRYAGLSEDLLDRSPFGLSAGEKRLVALAAMLAASPDILVLDEPAGDLGAGARRQLAELLLKTGIPAIVASQDLTFIQAISDRIILMDEGRVCADGPAPVILNDSRLLESHGLESPSDPPRY